MGRTLSPANKPQAGVEGMFPHMGIALGAEELQGEEGQEVVQGRNALALREVGRPDHLIEVELGHEGSKQEHPGPGGLQPLAVKLGKTRSARPAPGRQHP